MDIASEGSGSTRRGRRPAGSGARTAIIEAARERFGRSGYRGATLRQIANDAGVDPRLVLHYFGSKKELFMQSVQLPVDPQVQADRLFAPGPEGLGERAATMLVSALDDPETRRVMVSLVRAAASEPEAAELIRELLAERMLGPLTRHAGLDYPELRASMMGSQIVGLAVARHIVGLEPLTEASSQQLIRALAPAMQHYLTGDWVEEPPG